MYVACIRAQLELTATRLTFSIGKLVPFAHRGARGPLGTNFKLVTVHYSSILENMASICGIY